MTFAFDLQGAVRDSVPPRWTRSANRIIDRLTNTRSGERTVALLMFAYSFLAMTSHNILKPVTKSKFIDQLGSDNLPYVLMASSVLIGVLMHLYGGAIRRLPRQYVIPIAQSVLVALLVVFWALLRTAPSGSRWLCISSGKFSACCSSASSGRWPTRSTTPVRPSGSLV